MIVINKSQNQCFLFGFGRTGNYYTLVFPNENEEFKQFKHRTIPTKVKAEAWLICTRITFISNSETKVTEYTNRTIKTMTENHTVLINTKDNMG